MENLEPFDQLEEKKRRTSRKVFGVRLDPAFWRRVKHAAIDARQSLESYVEAALREKMGRAPDQTDS